MLLKIKCKKGNKALKKGSINTHYFNNQTPLIVQSNYILKYNEVINLITEQQFSYLFFE